VNLNFVVQRRGTELISGPPQIRSPAKEKSLPSKSALAHEWGAPTHLPELR
jgi:hypothetical protein